MWFNRKNMLERDLGWLRAASHLLFKIGTKENRKKRLASVLCFRVFLYFFGDIQIADRNVGKNFKNNFLHCVIFLFSIIHKFMRHDRTFDRNFHSRNARTFQVSLKLCKVRSLDNLGAGEVPR